MQNNLARHLAKHLRDVHFGGNWTSVNLRDILSGITWQDATRKVGGFNTIATLVFHTNYYVCAVTAVLQGGPLLAKDEYSFAHPPISSQEQWDAFLSKVWGDAILFADLIEQLPESRLWEPFTDERYGNYYRNIQGIIEHTHYHLGQITLLRKMIGH
jgi:hypothetical protein